MARIQGRLSKVMVSTDNTTFTEVKGMKEGSFNGSRSEIKVTSHDDGDFENYIAGRIDGTVDLKLYYDEADAGQTIVNTAWLAGTQIFFHYVTHPSAGQKAYTGSCIVTKHEEAGGDNDVMVLNTTLRITGAFVNASQTASDYALA
jgi:predicted secreted protein